MADVKRHANGSVQRQLFDEHPGVTRARSAQRSAAQQPAARKPSDAEIKRALDVMTPEGRALTLIKAAYQFPRPVVPR